MPSLADLASGAGDLRAIEVDVEVVPVEAFDPVVLAGGVARQGHVEGDLLTHIAVVPPGLLARAICAVRDGTCSPERGQSDNGHLDNCIDLRNRSEQAC
ncbi:hypothetical protein AB0N87_32250 [Streptomyces sp. NPDC093228]|uniref:hypothetical protein n=1 Tax=unclassified Streptomyces TaxID=2593676 RepID=UPI003447DEC3